MSIRDTRLQHELEKMQALKNESSLIDFQTRGNPPDEYMVLFKCKGLAEENAISEEHVVWIYLHAEYPQKPPIVRWKTPIFHPNILSLRDFELPHPVTGQIMQLQDILQNALASGIMPARFMNLAEGRVCLDTLDLNWTPLVTLYDLCLELGEMIQYKKYNLNDPLDHEAAEWARQNPHRLPIDTRELLDFGITWVSEPEIDITLSDE